MSAAQGGSRSDEFWKWAMRAGIAALVALNLTYASLQAQLSERVRAITEEMESAKTFQREVFAFMAEGPRWSRADAAVQEQGIKAWVEARLDRVPNDSWLRRELDDMKTTLRQLQSEVAGLRTEIKRDG